MIRSLTRRELAAIGNRIRRLGDMAIPIRHLTLARLVATAETPFGLASRMAEVMPDDPTRHVDAAALWALVTIAEGKLPKEPVARPLHWFAPDPRSPWTCKHCGYGRAEALKHWQEPS